jgi:hypothetical protein
MRLISYRNTSMVKLAIWFGAAGILISVATPSFVAGSWGEEAGIALAVLGGLAGLCALALYRARIHSLADQVLDCGEYLEVRRGQVQENIPFANIRQVHLTSLGALCRLSLRLTAPTRFGEQVEFMPEAHLWSNPNEMQRLAEALTARANRARIHYSNAP